MLTANEIRERYLKFFEKRGHKVIPSASLVPENDPSVLFTTAGMQPLVPYLLGEKHPLGNRIADIQKCVRTQDIEEVGDNTHDTFFEMLGNWSFGDYFKKEAIEFCYEFLTNKDEGLGLDKDRFYITVFAGDENAPKDEESKKIWMSLGVPENRVYYLKDNWWSPGDNGPCGPDTEVFYDVSENGLGDLSHDEFLKADEEQKIVEIGNNVLIEYEKRNGKVVGELEKKNIDFGGGLERQAMAVQKKNNIFETDLFLPLIEKIRENSENKDTKAERIVADHIRTSVFMISDGVLPSNTDRGYILRRLLRRAVRYADTLKMKEEALKELVDVVIDKYKDTYKNLKEKESQIKEEIKKEENKFRQTLKKGIKEFEKISLSSERISGKEAFKLFSTYGFPFELTLEMASEKNISVDEDEFKKEMQKHQELSKGATKEKFKGGLANTTEKTTKMHTATHLMLAGLRKYLGDNVYQAGSNITEERIRFDFTYPEKVNKDILDKVEDFVNEAISKKCNVDIEEMDKKEAKNSDVVGSFWEKYPDIVKIYTVKSGDGTIYSRELCGGPHVKNTKEMGEFKILKESSSSAGVRRIKAVLK